MDKRFLLITASVSALALIQSGCSSDPIVYQEPMGQPAYNKHTPRVSEIDGGYTQIHGGQVAIVSKKVHVVTLDPKPKVIMPKEAIIDFDEKPAHKTANAEAAKGNKQKNIAAKEAAIEKKDAVDAWQAWVDYCDGKELTMEQQELIDNSDMPPEFEGTCDRTEK